MGNLYRLPLLILCFLLNPSNGNAIIGSNHNDTNALKNISSDEVPSLNIISIVYRNTNHSLHVSWFFTGYDTGTTYTVTISGPVNRTYYAGVAETATLSGISLSDGDQINIKVQKDHTNYSDTRTYTYHAPDSGNGQTMECLPQPFNLHLSSNFDRSTFNFSWQAQQGYFMVYFKVWLDDNNDELPWHKVKEAQTRFYRGEISFDMVRSYHNTNDIQATVYVSTIPIGNSKVDPSGTQRYRKFSIPDETINKDINLYVTSGVNCVEN